MQGEPTGSEGRSEDNEKLEEVEEIDCKKKLDNERKSWAYNCEESVSPQMCCKMWETCPENNGSKSCKSSSKSGMLLSQSIKRCKSCGVHRTDRSSARKNWANGLKTMSGSVVPKNRMQRWMMLAKKPRKNLWHKRSWMRKLEACKLDIKGEAADFQSFTESSANVGCAAPTRASHPVHVLERKVEKKTRRSRGEERRVAKLEHQCRGFHNEGFPAGSVWSSHREVIDVPPCYRVSRRFESTEPDCSMFIVFDNIRVVRVPRLRCAF